MFSKLPAHSLARATLFKDTPIYVQFYVTPRCNLTCQQCNIIYANSDLRECSIDGVKRIADNLSEMGVAIVLLTGDEPFIRRELPEIIRAFEERDVHVRMQTNGFATEEQIEKAVEAGGHDISISLDSLHAATQNRVNGKFEGSWGTAIRAIGRFTRLLPAGSSFASLGCLLQKDNLNDIEDVIRFGSEIGWFTSLVPAHVADFDAPLSFRTFDVSQRFRPKDSTRVDHLLNRVRLMPSDGYLLYDSDKYLEDIKMIVRDGTTSWQEKNNGVCDSLNLYFVILPSGMFAPCCDHRLECQAFAFDEDFPRLYRDAVFRSEVRKVTAACEGCMYGSYPEMTIAMRYFQATVQRIGDFLNKPPPNPWPISDDKLFELTRNIYDERHTITRSA